MSSSMLEFLTYPQSLWSEENANVIANPLLICLPQAALPAQHSQATSSVSKCHYYMRERLHWQQAGHRKRLASRNRPT